MAVLLAAATFVEHFAGTAYAVAIYHNPVTIALWAALVAGWILAWTRSRRSIPFGSSLLHFAFALMLCGAFITMVGEKRGHMHLERGEARGMAVRDDGRAVALPFTLALDSLEVSRYPGTGNPSGFTSYVTVSRGGEAEKCVVSVNHPLKIGGWRIYQASYVPETGASIFSLAYDPVGMAVSYLGYALMLLAFIVLIFSPKSRFAQLRRQLSAAFALALMAVSCSPAPPESEVLAQDSHGRIVTLDSFSREFLRKVCHKESLDGRTPTASLLYLMASPDEVWERPLIHQKSGKDVSIAELFDSQGYYILDEQVRQALSVPSQKRSKPQKEVLKLDEKANLLYSVVEGRQLPVFPVGGGASGEWLSPGDDLSALNPQDSAFVRDMTSLLLADPSPANFELLSRYQQKIASSDLPSEGQVRQELLCNRIKPFKSAAMGYMTCALLLIAFSLLPGRGRGRAGRTLYAVALALTLFVFLLHSWGIAARWYCAGQPPLSNSYEISVFLAWCMALLSLVLSRRSGIASAIGVLFAGALLLVAMMSDMDPAITPLVPVLQSPWLMFHVAVIIAGYGCFAINFLLAVYGLGTIAVCGESAPAVRKAAALVEMFALAGLMLMTLGTFLGAVWAGESWGSYWSWDPKETWALITVLVYAICTHARLVPRLNTPKCLCILSIAAFACVLFTYFGVNFFLVGMHSYAG